MKTIKIKDQISFWRTKRAESLPPPPEPIKEPKTTDQLINELMLQIVRLKKQVKTK